MKPAKSGNLSFIKRLMMINIILAVGLFSVSTYEYIDVKAKNDSEASIVFAPGTTPVVTKNIEDTKEIAITTEEIIPTKEELYENMLNQNIPLIAFYASMFNVMPEDIINNLRALVINEENIDINNLGFIKDDEGNLITYNTPDLSILTFVENYALVNNIKQVYVPYTGNKEYVESLIGYFTSLYPNVNYNIAISIGAAESGYYTASGMLRANNIFGGMYNGRLIKYSNIEQGILKYIRLLNNNYFAKGLNTFESIGKVYCPQIVNGAKVASSHWLNLVYKATEKYPNEAITANIGDIMNLK